MSSRKIGNNCCISQKSECFGEQLGVMMLIPKWDIWVDFWLLIFIRFQKLGLILKQFAHIKEWLEILFLTVRNWLFFIVNQVLVSGVCMFLFAHFCLEIKSQYYIQNLQMISLIVVPNVITYVLHFGNWLDICQKIKHIY